MVATLNPCAPPDAFAGERPMRVVRTWGVVDPGGIGTVRREMTHLLVSSVPAGGHDDASAPDTGGICELRNRVALSCSELVTNALRHGLPPVCVRLLTDGTAWMLDVADGDVDRLPVPSPERPLGQGGYGLMLVARLASQVGWYVRDDAKHVWARLESAPDADLVRELTG